MHDYPNMYRISYESGAVFIPVCEVCKRFVKADETIFITQSGLSAGNNATCKYCGRTTMIFEGFI